MFLVSSGFSLEKSGDLVWGSDSPVSEELSTCMEGSTTSHTGRKAIQQWRPLKHQNPLPPPTFLIYSTIQSIHSTVDLFDTRLIYEVFRQSLLYLATMCRYDPKVSWNSVSSFHLYQISNYNTFSIYAHLLTISDYKSLLKDSKETIHVTSNSQKIQVSWNSSIMVLRRFLLILTCLSQTHLRFKKELFLFSWCQNSLLLPRWQQDG